MMPIRRIRPSIRAILTHPHPPMSSASQRAWEGEGRRALKRKRLGLVAHLEGGDEGGLGDLHLAELAHALLALLLLLEELSFARDVATVALREHVLALGLH